MLFGNTVRTAKYVRNLDIVKIDRQKFEVRAISHFKGTTDIAFDLVNTKSDTRFVMTVPNDHAFIVVNRRKK